jgi:hypothetical protein
VTYSENNGTKLSFMYDDMSDLLKPCQRNKDITNALNFKATEEIVAIRNEITKIQNK